jgi:hypothetical protein
LDELAISGDFGDGVFFGESLEREGEGFGDVTGEVETAGDVFAGEQEVDLDRKMRTRSVRAP